MDNNNECATSGNRIISLRNVTARYDNQEILQDINLDVCRNDFLAISGPNGGGKTTLLRLMLKLLRPAHGKVTYYDYQENTTRHLSIGYLPQKNSIDQQFPVSVRQVVLSGLLKGWGMHHDPDETRKLDHVVEMLGLAPFIDNSINALSGGQLQRTLLARAIISEPELVILDEPLSYVDKYFEQQIYSVVAELAKASTIILVSHEMTIISTMANRHIIVNRSITPCESAKHGPKDIFCP